MWLLELTQVSSAIRNSSEYFSTDKYRKDSSVDFGHKNLLKTTTAGSSPEGHNISGVYEESSTSSRTVQGLDSQTSSSAKSSTRDGELHGSSSMSNAGWCFLLANLFHGICGTLFPIIRSNISINCITFMHHRTYNNKDFCHRQSWGRLEMKPNKNLWQPKREKSEVQEK
jgi:hypothetical protein